MATNGDGNGASPTTENVNPSQELDVTKLTPEQLEAHPYVQDLKKKYSAAHDDMDKTNLTKKQLQAENARFRVLAGVEPETPAPKEDDKPLTKAELEKNNEDLRWELTNAKDVELYGDDKYKADLKAGIPRAYALENAILRYKSNPDKVRLERQQQMASGTAVGSRNLQSDEFTDIEQKGIAAGLYTKETVLKHRELKRARGQL